MTSKEAIETIKHPFTCCHYGKKHKQASEVIEKDLKVLEIIKKKEVVVGLLKGILHSDIHTHTSSYYNSYFVANYRHLTQEEFDLLKEWIKNDK